jgi:hypothetical protein
MKINWQAIKYKSLDRIYHRSYTPMRDQLNNGVWYHVKVEVSVIIENQINEVWDRAYHQTKEELRALSFILE